MVARKSRRIVAWLLLATCVSLAAMGADSATAWMGEMVPWPMMATGIAARQVELSEHPTEEVELPDLCGDEVQYALLPLGDGPDPGITCAVIVGSQDVPSLLVDVQNNESLADDVWLSPTRRLDLDAYGWLVEVMVEFPSGGAIRRIPYHILITGEYSYETGSYVWFYGGSCHRRGVLTVDGAAYPIAVTNLQTTGGYEDPETLVLAVDVDRDGVLNTLPGSHEVFGPGEAISIAEGAYRIHSVQADGTQIEFERVGEPSPRPAIEPGLPAPGFEVGSVTGDVVTVPDDQLTTVVVFLASGRSSGCSTCGLDRFVMPERVRDLERVLSDQAPGVARIVVVTDREVSAENLRAAISDVPVAVCVAPDVVELYRGTEELLVIDAGGTIAALDQFWFTYVEGRPVIQLHRLSALDVASIVNRLTY